MALRFPGVLEIALLSCLTPFLALPMQKSLGPRSSAEHDGDRIEPRIGDIRRRLGSQPPRSTEASELAKFSKRYLDAAQDALLAGRFFAAQRLADAADDRRRPIDHLIRSTEEQPTPSLPPSLGDRLKKIYFRLRLCNYFLQEIPSPKPERLLALARHFYEESVRAQEGGKLRAADGYAKWADDLTHALENLAQAYLTEGPPPIPARQAAKS
jgi:hypothetical protein